MKLGMGQSSSVWRAYVDHHASVDPRSVDGKIAHELHVSIVLASRKFSLPGSETQCQAGLRGVPSKPDFPFVVLVHLSRYRLLELNYVDGTCREGSQHSLIALETELSVSCVC